MIRVGWGEVRIARGDARRPRSGSRVKLGAHFLPEDFPDVRRVRAGGRARRLRARLARRRPDALAGPLRLHDARARGDGADRRRQRRHEPAHAPPDGDRERARDARRPPPRPRHARDRPRRQRGADARAQAGADAPSCAEIVPRLRELDGRRRRDRRRRHPLGERAGADHDLRDRAEEPAPRGRARRHRDDLRRRPARPPCAGRSTTFAPAPRRPAATPTTVEIAALCAMHVSDDQEEAWERVPLGAGRVREPHRVRAEVEPGARHAGGDDAPRRRARRTTTTTPATSTRRPSTRAT